MQVIHFFEHLYKEHKTLGNKMLPQCHCLVGIKSICKIRYMRNASCVSLKPSFHMIIESQNSQGWKGPQDHLFFKIALIYHLLILFMLKWYTFSSEYLFLNYSSYSLKHLEVASSVNSLSAHSCVILKYLTQAHFNLVQKT